MNEKPNDFHSRIASAVVFCVKAAFVFWLFALTGPFSIAAVPGEDDSLERLFDDLFAEVGRIEKLEDRITCLHDLLDARIANGYTVETLETVRLLANRPNSPYKPHQVLMYGTVARGQLLNGEPVESAWETIEKGKEAAKSINNVFKRRDALEGMFYLFIKAFASRYDSGPVAEDDREKLFANIDRIVEEIKDFKYSEKDSDSLKGPLALLFLLNGDEERAEKFLEGLDEKRLWYGLYKPFLKTERERFLKSGDMEVFERVYVNIKKNQPQNTYQNYPNEWLIEGVTYLLLAGKRDDAEKTALRIWDTQDLDNGLRVGLRIVSEYIERGDEEKAVEYALWLIEKMLDTPEKESGEKHGSLFIYLCEYSMRIFDNDNLLKIRAAVGKYGETMKNETDGNDEFELNLIFNEYIHKLLDFTLILMDRDYDEETLEKKFLEIRESIDAVKHEEDYMTKSLKCRFKNIMLFPLLSAYSSSEHKKPSPEFMHKFAEYWHQDMSSLDDRFNHLFELCPHDAMLQFANNLAAEPTEVEDDEEKSPEVFSTGERTNTFWSDDFDMPDIFYIKMLVQYEKLASSEYEIKFSVTSTEPQFIQHFGRKMMQPNHERMLAAMRDLPLSGGNRPLVMAVSKLLAMLGGTEDALESVKHLVPWAREISIMEILERDYARKQIVDEIRAGGGEPVFDLPFISENDRVKYLDEVRKGAEDLNKHGFEREAAVLFWSLGRMENLYGYFERSAETAKQLDLAEHAPWKLLMEIDSASHRFRKMAADSPEKIAETKKILDAQIAAWKLEIESWKPIMRNIGYGLPNIRERRAPFAARRIAVLMIAEMQSELEKTGLVSEAEIDASFELAMKYPDTFSEHNYESEQTILHICFLLIENRQFDLLSKYMREARTNLEAFDKYLLGSIFEELLFVSDKRTPKLPAYRNSSLKEGTFRHTMVFSSFLDSAPGAHSNDRINRARASKWSSGSTRFSTLPDELKALDY